ncbi:MAG: hypothetical protein RBR23_05055 [Arcobacteraceae bacterium]|jgi:hypothetical protein|nr:hypothetical protein [Arcobacteraceae bacterium]
MQVTHTANTYKAQQTIGVKSTESTTRFDIAYYAKKDPKEISYDEYKTFTKDNVEQLYPKDTMPKENEKANSLLIKATGTDDEILNKVLFDKEIKSDDSEFTRNTSQMLDILMENWEAIEQFKLALAKTEEYIKQHGIKFEGSPDRWISEYSKINSKMMQETIVPDNEKIISAEELFQVFEYNKQGAQTLIEYYGYTPADKQYRYMQSMISYEESIKSEYDKRVQEKNSILASYMTNNQATQNKIANAQEAQKEQEHNTKTSEEEIKQDSKETTLQKLMEDIRSVLRTGFTVAELEYIAKLIDEIKKLIKEKEDGNANVSDSEIEKLIKTIEKELLVLEKKLNGVVIIEKDDEPNPHNSETTLEQSNTDFELRLDVIQKKLDNMRNGKSTNSIDENQEKFK